VQTIVGAALGSHLTRLLARPEIRLSACPGATRSTSPPASSRRSSRPDLEVVSVMGGLTQGSDLNSFEITTRLADL
jgi:lsr operon transcriptional repressor